MGIAVTEKAAKELLNVKKEQSLDDNVFVRVGITGGGCAGFSYNLEFEEGTIDTDNESVLEVEGLKFVVDKKSMLYLDGTTLDFYTDLNKRGFVFDNPNSSKNCDSSKNCGCGKSFSA